MLPTELRLAGLRHCFVQLPELFLTREPNLKLGAIICIRAIQSDKELYVTWDGQLTGGDYVLLDLTFAKANGFGKELVVINSGENLQPTQCSSCQAEPVNSSEYAILLIHQNVRLLDTCRLIHKDLIVPIWVSQGVHVLVFISSFQPCSRLSLLSSSTEMQFSLPIDKVPQESAESSKHEIVEDEPIKEPVALISCAFSPCKPRFHLGSLLVVGERGSGKTFFLQSTINKYKRYYGTIFNCKQLRGKRPESVKKKLFELFDGSLERQPSILCLDDIDFFVGHDPKHEEELGQEAIYNKRLVDILCELLKKVERTDKRGRDIMIVATCRSRQALDERVSKPIGRQFFTDTIKLCDPNLKERATILRNILSGHKQVQHSIDLDQFEHIAKKCNSFMPLDLKQLIERAIINACARSLNGFDVDLVSINLDDFEKSLEGYVPLNLRGVSLKPKNGRTFENIGGMHSVKSILRKTILIPLKYPKLFKKCPLKPMTSILLYGPPGCGKTLIAEALTNEESINSISVKGPELLSKYIGASEAAVRDLFKRAELAKPCVIFFDEFESLVAKRGSDSSGVTDRVVNQFLTVLDGVDSLSCDVFIVAATSRPDMIDPAMLRPGRLDKHVYCPAPDESDRYDILRVLSQAIEFEGQNDVIDLTNWAKRLDGFTGADIKALLYSAQLKALHDLIEIPLSEAQQMSGTQPVTERAIRVGEDHLEASFREMEPEISNRRTTFAWNYPKSFRKLSQKQVSTRATLA